MLVGACYSRPGEEFVDDALYVAFGCGRNPHQGRCPGRRQVVAAAVIPSPPRWWAA